MGPTSASACRWDLLRKQTSSATPAFELRATRLLGGTTVAVALSSASCHGERAEALRAEAGVIAHAVQGLRDAPNDGKRVLLEVLERAPCSAEDVCALKRACVEAYALEVRALDGIRAVRHQTREPDAVSADAAELLARSELDLRRATGLAKACADLEGEARRRHSL